MDTSYKSHRMPSTGMRAPSSMSTIESSVTSLLVATKKLLESLTQWAEGQVSEHEVSNVYVALGNEFNIACRAFIAAGVGVTDLGDVPQALRVILERALSEDASQEILDRYLPSIRKIVVNLLNQLKDKQAALKNHQQRQQYQQRQQTQVHSQQSVDSFERQKLSQKSPTYSTSSVQRSDRKRSTSNDIPHGQPSSQYPPRCESLISPRGHSKQYSGPSPSSSDSRSDTSSFPPSERGVSLRQSQESPREPPSRRPPQHSTVTAPMSKKERAFAALQNSEALERRASKRFSAYQIAKLTNGTLAGTRDIPPLPASEAISNPQGSILPTKSSHTTSPADYMSSTVVVEEQKRSRSSSPGQNQNPLRRGGSSTILSETAIAEEESEDPVKNGNQNNVKKNDVAASSSLANSTSTLGPISVYLQIGKRTKKALIEDPLSLTIQSLRLQFIEIFAYAGGVNGFPEIYVLDPKTHVRYELEESGLRDISEGTLLALNIDENDGLRQYFDESLMKLRHHFTDLTAKVNENASLMKQLKDQASEQVVSSSRSSRSSKTPLDSKMKVLDGLRKDVATIHQISKSTIGAAKDELSSLMDKTQRLQDVANLGSAGSSRAYMEACHQKLSSDTDKLILRVDDILDIIEAMRIDVATRGVRHDQRQIKGVCKELELANKEHQAMQRYINDEKSRWKKIWEKELVTICEERQFFNLQEELVVDLQQDLNKAQETFGLVEACSVEQSRGNGRRKPTPPIFTTSTSTGISNAKDAVLSEVSALQPNSEARVEAIERAERLRERERQIIGKNDFGDDFERELHEFVKENKLNKSGGVEEAERRRLLRDLKVKEERQKHEAELRAARERERNEKAGKLIKEEKASKSDSAVSSSSFSSAESNAMDAGADTASFSSPDLAETTAEHKRFENNKQGNIIVAHDDDD